MTPWPYPSIVAHRGGGKLAPENTLEAIDVGARLGLRMIEFDAKLSANDVVFLLHDDDVDRTSNGHGAAKSMTYAQLHARCVALGLMANVEIKPCEGRDVETDKARRPRGGGIVGWRGGRAVVVVVFVRSTAGRTRRRAGPAARHAL